MKWFTENLTSGINSQTFLTLSLTEVVMYRYLKIFLMGMIVIPGVNFSGVGTFAMEMESVAWNEPDAKAVALVVDSPPGKLRLPETDTLCETARRIVPGIPVLVPDSNGNFYDENGRNVTIDARRVLWFYQGDTILSEGAFFSVPMRERLRQFVSEGGGLLLSGGAAAMMEPVTGVPTSITPMTFGHDRAQAGLEPLETTVVHPLFHEMTCELRTSYPTGRLWFSNAMYPAFASLVPDATRSETLARGIGETEMPLVQWRDGDGRVLAAGWRISCHFDSAGETFRYNTEQFFRNALVYLDAQKRAEYEASCSREMTSEQWWTERRKTLYIRPLRRALEFLNGTFGVEHYPEGEKYLAKLGQLEACEDFPMDEYETLRREALSANPLLDFSQILLVKRGEARLGLPQNYSSNSVLETHGYENEIAVLSWRDGNVRTLYRPTECAFVGDVDLDFDANRILF
ncbi:MAG: hypothetical protein Q4C47_08235, partial [Planctomycetia bacterium]|nr:hypothetical protein [Planctomycetia bacterium]